MALIYVLGDMGSGDRYLTRRKSAVRRSGARLKKTPTAVDLEVDDEGGRDLPDWWLSDLALAAPLVTFGIVACWNLWRLS